VDAFQIAQTFPRLPGKDAGIGDLKLVITQHVMESVGIRPMLEATCSYAREMI
jgi:hypothetical protein